MFMPWRGELAVRSFIQLTVLVLLLLGAGTSAFAQKRVLTNEDLDSASSAPVPAAPAEPTAQQPGADQGSTPVSAVPPAAPVREEVVPGSIQQAKLAIEALAEAEEFLSEKLASDPSPMVADRWNTMRDQIVAIIAEIRSIQEAEERAAAKSSTPTAAGSR